MPRLYQYIYTERIYCKFRALLPLHIWLPIPKSHNCDAIDLPPIATSNALNITIVIARHNSTCLRECTIIKPTDLPSCDFELLPYILLHLKNKHYSGTRIAIDTCGTDAAILSTAVCHQQSADNAQAPVSSTVSNMHCNVDTLIGSGRKCSTLSSTHKKHDALRELISLPDAPAIFCVTESKLNKSIDDSELKIGGYALFRSDRNRYGGGTIYSRRFLLPSNMMLSKEWNTYVSK